MRRSNAGDFDEVEHGMVDGILSYRRTLESFVRCRAAMKADWFEESHTWPAEMLAFAANPALGGFQWLGVRAGGDVRTFGIRALIDEPFFSLAAFEAQGFELESTRLGEAVPDGSRSGHYWIAEIQSSTRVVIWACAFTPPRSWHLFDEHVLSRSDRRRFVPTLVF